MTASRQDRESDPPVTLEVEVTEIDGITRTTPPPEQPPSHGNVRPADPAEGTWSRAGRYVRTLDARWWPLWIFLGAIALVLALTVGLALAVVFLIFRAIVAVARWIFG